MRCLPFMPRLAVFVLLLGLVPVVLATPGTVTASILAAQSNMEGHGQIPSLNHQVKALPPVSSLAETPPMGWNSWNAFEKEIDEAKIRAIADAMVNSGMRDAGYRYLVIDDAWMASERDAAGCLVADPNKFPSGMKALGDYIHDRGLKYGLYQDRGRMTCQQLPGSFGHEQIDMATFAAWGVDYIKLDSCFAESNGRMSSVDYALYHQCIQAAGRSMVLSISDFGNAAWAWGGKDSAQLWRTSNDIYPWMDSVYGCAETSAGDRKIHPAFNGLWQFAGPGHWNDPDMLHVGNLKQLDEAQRATADRAHFSLWCILAAPLMAGNDLRDMNGDTRRLLTAPELIAVNQDRRGVQGCKVFERDGCEIYNKPLADGTTAVLLLNKKRKKVAITVHWSQIGLAGRQPVRDLWTRKELGEFEESFTVRELGQHEHRMIKVGRPGPPLPLPAPVPLANYTVTRPGKTYLTDLYYIWKSGNEPAYDATFKGTPIQISGQTFEKGIGAKGKCAVMFKVTDRAHRFRATVALADTSPIDAEGRFRVYNEDFFANRVLWDSGKMTRDSLPQEINIDLNNVQCLMLVLEGKDVLGNWADAHVINEAEHGRLDRGTIGLQIHDSSVKSTPMGAQADRIKPRPGNPWTWQYQGKSVLLLGASDQDNLFQMPDLKDHLDLLASVGGNYIRNVMSSRDIGNVWPFYRLPNGKYDLEKFNPAYWNRFENLLRWTHERDIVIQIELWDQFDYKSKIEKTEGLWEKLNPYNPDNNINYTVEQTGLAAPLGNLDGKENGFFRSVPALENNQTLLRYQQKQVDKILELALPYPHVLYTIDNETHGPQEWGQYWARYIYQKARALGVDVYVTEMWNKRELLSSQQKQTLDHPDIYPFVDISQNSRNKDQTHWDNIMRVRGYLSDLPRPLNNVKIYGGLDAWWGSGTARDGLERFWRDILGGCASARMHRPDYGLGLSESSRASIRSARMVLAELDIFSCRPDAESSLLQDRQDDEAYLTCIPGRQYAVYFTDGGQVKLDLEMAEGVFLLKWLDIMKSIWVSQTQIQGGKMLTLQPPSGGHWIALLIAP